MTDEATISEREDGPFVAKGVRSMKGPDGTDIEVKPVMALCRCGHSSNKPFCDGSHKRVGFQSRGGEPAGKDKILTYEGSEVTVYYNPRVCSHAAECGRAGQTAFAMSQRPWIQPDNEPRAVVEEIVAACPSGALRLSDPGAAPQVLLAERPEITVEPNGPYRVQGIDSPVPPPGEGQTGKKYVLCRCGLSGNKPFCDGSHKDAGWKDTQTAPAEAE